jgi:hypothetical protein
MGNNFVTQQLMEPDFLEKFSQISSVPSSSQNLRKITVHQEVYHEALSTADVRPCASQCLAELTTVFVEFCKNLSNLASPCLPVYIGAGCDRPLIVFQSMIGLIESKRPPFPPNKMHFFLHHLCQSCGIARPMYQV